LYGDATYEIGIGKSIQVQAEALKSTTPAVTGVHSRCRFIGIPVASIGEACLGWWIASRWVWVNPNEGFTRYLIIFSSDPPIKVEAKLRITGELETGFFVEA